MYADQSYHQTESGQFVYAKSNYRSNFVFKVFSIVAAQLILTSAIVAACRSFVALGEWAEILSPMWIIGLIVTAVLLNYSRDLARNVPVNYILLSIYTICEAFLLHFSVKGASLNLIMNAMLLTGAAVEIAGIISYKSKLDLTNSKFILYCVSVHLIVNLIFALFIGYSIIYVYFSTLIILAYLIFDLQIILGSREKALGIDEYIWAAVNLYSDIVLLFIKLVQILKNLEEKDKKKKRN